MESAEERIQERLRNYLKRDGIGIRKAVLKLFLSDGAYTTEDVFTYLAKEGFDVSYRGVSAMVGLMNTRLGILSIDDTITPAWADPLFTEPAGRAKAFKEQASARDASYSERKPHGSYSARHRRHPRHRPLDLRSPEGRRLQRRGRLFRQR